MAKITVEGNVYEGTPEELKEIFEMLGVKFPVEYNVETAEEVKYAIGDYVKILSEGRYGRASEWNIGKIVPGVRNYEDGDYRVNRLDDRDHDYFYPNNLAKATDEEVAQAKSELERKQSEKAEREALEEKWAKIGRKPNEFRKGDIVRVTGSYGGHEIGTIGEVVDAPEYIGTDFGVLANGIKKSHIGQMELIAPVESRFDKDSE